MSTKRKKKELWKREQAIGDLLEIKERVFESILSETESGNTCDQKLVKLAIDVIKELNSISGFEASKSDDSDDGKLEVNINVVEGQVSK